MLKHSVTSNYPKCEWSKNKKNVSAKYEKVSKVFIRQNGSFQSRFIFEILANDLSVTLVKTIYIYIYLDLVKLIVVTNK